MLRAHLRRQGIFWGILKAQVQLGQSRRQVGVHGQLAGRQRQLLKARQDPGCWVPERQGAPGFLQGLGSKVQLLQAAHGLHPHAGKAAQAMQAQRAQRAACAARRHGRDQAYMQVLPQCRCDRVLRCQGLQAQALHPPWSVLQQPGAKGRQPRDATLAPRDSEADAMQQLWRRVAQLVPPAAHQRDCSVPAEAAPPVRVYGGQGPADQGRAQPRPAGKPTISVHVGTHSDRSHRSSKGSALKMVVSTSLGRSVIDGIWTVKPIRLAVSALRWGLDRRDALELALLHLAAPSAQLQCTPPMCTQAQVCWLLFSSFPDVFRSMHTAASFRLKGVEEERAERGTRDATGRREAAGGHCGVRQSGWSAVKSLCKTDGNRSLSRSPCERASGEKQRWAAHHVASPQAKQRCAARQAASPQVSAPSEVAMVRMLASKRGEVSGEPWA